MNISILRLNLNSRWEWDLITELRTMIFSFRAFIGKRITASAVCRQGKAFFYRPSMRLSPNFHSLGFIFGQKVCLSVFRMLPINRIKRGGGQGDILPVSFLSRSGAVSRSGKAGGFTLPEIMVAMLVVLFLGALVLGGYNRVVDRTEALREVNAGRNLSNAFHLYASDNGGRFMPGIDQTIFSTGVRYQDRIITGMIAERYPFRLAPYLDFTLDGNILLDSNRADIEKMNMGDYAISLLPTFGMNHYMVGGYIGTDGQARGFSTEEVILHRSQADVSILVFASAGIRGMNGNKVTEGYFRISIPINPMQGNWNTLPWKRDADPGLYGNVHARHGGEAVCVFLDGSVSMHGIEELRDMRFWSRNAVLLDDPYYMPAY